ncbi:hypothetical protein BX600DRAFT_494291 [Xylariales sp. PMI_506]|nr:hypothetical protein BX600DRAFT_494291 [Xylariales sp. PMI_506]
MASSDLSTDDSQPLDFLDFDDAKVFGDTKQNAAAESCMNFVLEFGADHARIARNLTAQHFETLLREERRAEYPVRWINIWDTSAQAGVIEEIGTKYAFSHRLISLMKYATKMKERAAANKKKTALSTKSSPRSAHDLEKGPRGDVSLTTISKATAGLPMEGEEIDLYLVLKDTVNYTSIDHTEKALCIGAHWLYRRPKPYSEKEQKLLPPKHWLWLTLCDDNTVITFHETPDLEPTPLGTADREWREEQYRSMRSNLLNVLLQQSNQGFDMFKQSPLSQSPIRQALQSEHDRRSTRHQGMKRLYSDFATVDLQTPAEHRGTSLLFYYLFEDYAAAGPLQAAGTILETMTPKVLKSANRNSKVSVSEIIPRLHNLSKDLRTLKHLFEIYKILITKVMAATKQPPSGAGLGCGVPHDGPAALARSSTDTSAPSSLGRHANLRVYLTQDAMQRFDRLRDRLQGLMLNTIEGYLEEITALQETYFNLTQQKDSAATERLTRSATLLAKLSVFFLPIGFITSYFSVQITDMYESWTAGLFYNVFAGTAAISFVCVFFFGRLLMFFSDALDDWTEALSLGFWALCAWVGRRLGRRRRAEEEEDEEEEEREGEGKGEGGDEK